jgi:Ser/Thr protein kinase RdoA (MazF antagonist)
MTAKQLHAPNSTGHCGARPQTRLRRVALVVMLALMMRLAEIYGLARTVDDQGHSPVADAAAALWGFAPGAAAHWRSSASHVFVVRHARVYLRLTPADHRPYGEVLSVARLMQTLRRRGLAVARPVPSNSGALAETAGNYHAMVVEAAPGRQGDVGALTPDRAAKWGRALAHLHSDGGNPGVTLPEPFRELARVTEVFPDDPALVAAAADIVQRLANLPRDESRFGTVHGDFELDNLCWDGSVATAYDFDETAQSWFLADIAYAVRDLTPLTDRSADLFAAFLAGYRVEHPLADADLALLALFTAAHALCSAVRVHCALDPTQPDDPPWLVALREKLHRYVRQQRDIALDRSA